MKALLGYGTVTFVIWDYSLTSLGLVLLIATGRFLSPLSFERRYISDFHPRPFLLVSSPPEAPVIRGVQMVSVLFREILAADMSAPANGLTVMIFKCLTEQEVWGLSVPGLAQGLRDVIRFHDSHRSVVPFAGKKGIKQRRREAGQTGAWTGLGTASQGSTASSWSPPGRPQDSPPWEAKKGMALVCKLVSVSGSLVKVCPTGHGVSLSCLLYHPTLLGNQ